MGKQRIAVVVFIVCCGVITALSCLATYQRIEVDAAKASLEEVKMTLELQQNEAEVLRYRLSRSEATNGWLLCELSAVADIDTLVCPVVIESSGWYTTSETWTNNHRWVYTELRSN